MRRILIALALCAACGKGSEPPPPTTGSPTAKPETGPRTPPVGGAAPAAKSPADQARAMFETVCAVCHGANGKGDGAAAANLNPKPRDYTDPKWQASVTDDQIKQTILLGGAGVGKSPMMPAQPQLKNQPQVLDELVKIIRGFGKQGS
jgi:mono/diheme cytochrome c family protein